MSASRRSSHLAPAVTPRRSGRPRGPSQAPRVRQRLIDEASRLYADGGYAGISFAALAQHTGLRKATVFHYFPNKETLLDAIFQALGERLEAAALGFEPPPASHTQRLDRVIASLVNFYGDDPVNARMLCQGLLEVDRSAQGRLAGNAAPAVFTGFVGRFVDFLQSGIAAGEFYPDRPLGTIMSIGGIILFEFMLPERARRIYAGSGTTLAERRNEMIAVVRRAVVRPRERLRQRGLGRRSQ